jgi:acetyl-CoA carboxylase alpha subunit
MTPEELQQIQAIIQAAVAPLATKQEIQALDTKVSQVETRLQTQIAQVETRISAVETRVEKSETKILTKLDQLEKLTADYLDGRVQTVTRRVDRIEKHLNLT